MNLVAFRRMLLRVFIIFLCLSAGLAVIGVLGGDLGGGSWKIVLSTLCVSGASMCGMVCTGFLQRHAAHPAGRVGIVASAAGGILVVGGILAEADNAGYWKLCGVTVILAVGLAYTLGLCIPRLASRHRWVQTCGAGIAGFLTVFYILAVLAPGQMSYFAFLSWQFFVITIILLMLFTVLIPLLARLAGAPAELPETASQVSFTFVSEGIYRDASGALYSIRRLEPDED